jgi:DNA mismatch repair protein MutS
MARPKTNTVPESPATPEATARAPSAREVADAALAAAMPPANQATPVAYAEATPSMAQFLEIKTANPDSILWYRMGDFYELFFEDAVIASAALGIVLTKRGKHLGQDIPMCGVPIHRADDYLQKLIKKGYRVAVCEQMEDPAEARKRGAKAIVRRDVVRLVTPGTITEDTLLDAKARNYLTALFVAPGATGASLIAADAVVGLASLDISTGEFEVGEVTGCDLPGELIRLSPSEIILTQAAFADKDLRRWIELSKAASTPTAAASFDSGSGEHLLKARLGVSDLGGIGHFSRVQLSAIGALLKYIDLTQIGRIPVIRPPKMTGNGAILVIDAATRSSLELVRTASGERTNSLLGAIDRTVTGAGSRELAARIASPLADARAINARLDCVAFLADDDRLRDDLRAVLRTAPDIARGVTRLAFGRGGPRDLGCIRDGLDAALRAYTMLAKQAEPMGLPTDLAAVRSALSGVSPKLSEALANALADDLPHVRRDGGFIKLGAHAELDDARRLRDDSRQVMAALEAKYIAETGVKSLKVRHNNILGYFIEVTVMNAGPLQTPPHSEIFRHRQSMANAMRFSTLELVDIEGRIAAAADRALGLEQELFNELATAVAKEERGLLDIARALAELDCMASLAEVAREQGYVRPTIDTSAAFAIHGGRHPVVEQALDASKAGAFIENDCVLGRPPASSLYPGMEKDDTSTSSPDARIWLVTGPNMAGKSTFLRQNALIALLAQIGSYVPARSAHIGIVDRLFSRVGASDDLARGRSTFMVEMVETAAILNQATQRSLVILDEIGRGTSTFDGLSIAWATVEFLHDRSKCRALFATHYHELTALAGRLAGVANVTMDVKDWQDEIVFLHKVKPGAADRSYGIQVAKLAGLPKPVVDRAREVLTLLEKNDRKRGGGQASLDDLPLFAAARPKGQTDGPLKPSAADLALSQINPDDLTPKAALDALYKLKALAVKQA